MFNSNYPYVVEVTFYDDLNNKMRTEYPLLYAGNFQEVMALVEDLYGENNLESCNITLVGCEGDVFEVDKETADRLIKNGGSLTDDSKI